MIRIAMMIALLVGLLLSGCSPLATPQPVSEISVVPQSDSIVALHPDGLNRILLVGNTHMSMNKGLDAHLVALAASAEPPIALEVVRISEPGAQLWTLLEQDGARATIRDGGWDAVVLQAAGLSAPELFQPAVVEFVEEIRNAGAQPLLFVPQNEAGESSARASRTMAAALDVPVLQMSSVWEKVRAEQPDLVLEDPEHAGYATIPGTYLNTAAIYASLFCRSPEGLAYRPTDLLPDPDGEASGVVTTFQAIHDEWQISDEDVAFLQKIAWQMVGEGVDGMSRSRQQ